MLIPINATTFKKSFLSGSGQFELVTDENSWQMLAESGLPFDERVDSLAELSFGLGTSKPFSFGSKGELELKIGLESQTAGGVDLIWDKSESALIDKYDLAEHLTNDRLYMAVYLDSKLDGKLSGSYPVGPISTSFGIEAGGSARYAYLKSYDKSESVKDIVTDLFSGIRLPNQVNTVDEIPGPGEVVALEYGGYLNLSAGLTWGFSTTGSQSFEVRDLAVAANYDVKIAAAIDVGFKVAGDFSIEVHEGSQPGWARFVVRKKKSRSWSFAEDLGITANYNVDGIPDSADEFLNAIFGTKTEKFFEYFELAQKYSSLEELEKEAGKFSQDYLAKFSDKYVGKVLKNQNLSEVLVALRKVSDQYKSIDQRIISIYEDQIGKITEFKGILGKILQLQTFEGLEGLTDSKAWDLIKQVSGDKFYDVLVDQSEFGKMLEQVSEIKDFLDDGAKKQIRDVIADLKKDYKVDSLFQELKKYDTPEKLKNLADTKLQAVVEELVGKAFDEIDNFKDELEVIKKTLDNIQTFKEKWFEKIKEASAQKLEFNLRYAYNSASVDEKLMDVELKLSVQKGRELASKAAAGDFAEIIRSYNAAYVKINPNTVFTTKITKSAHLQVNVFGWGFESKTELLQNIQHAIETERGGLMHVFALDTQIKQLKRKDKRKKLLEEMRSNFVLRAVGETFQPADDGSTAFEKGTNNYVISTLRNMSTGYELFYEDSKTKPKELLQYLSLAQTMGLIADTGEFIEELERQFPDGFGEVSVEYVVRYDDQTTRNAFTMSGELLKAHARLIVREAIAARFIGLRQKDWNARLGFAYLDPRWAQLFRSTGPNFVNKKIFAELPTWFTGNNSVKQEFLLPVQRSILATIYRIENRYVDRINRLDELIDRAQKDGETVPLDELAKASRDFIGMADDLDKFGQENTFFIAFDRLAREGSAGKWKRESAMILKIRPENGEEVVKYVMG